jgi:glycosyltransferase involved in cell wall biosynthesis
MRVILDISAIGLGMLHPEGRGGAFRADEHLLEELAASGDCELLFCANHSSVTYDAAVAYLAGHPRLASHRVLGPPRQAARSWIRRGMTIAYRGVRRMFPAGEMPAALRAGGQLLDRSIHRPVTDSADGADVFHSTYFPLPPRPRGRSPQRFLTIYDLRYSRFPELYDARSIAVGQSILKSVGPRDWVITSSEASRRELVASGTVEPHQVFVVPLAADRNLFHPCTDPVELRRVRARHGIGEAPYILSLNSIDIRKNMHRAIAAFARLVRQERMGDLRFVIAGSPGSGSALMAEALAEAADVRGRIIHAGLVEDRDLAALYSGAAAFLYPSFYEGFGLPPLEAMQCGTPVITSDASSLPEVVGDAGLTVPAEDVDAMSAALLRVLSDSALRSSLAEKSIARASGFSWQRTAAGVLAAYRASLRAG